MAIYVYQCVTCDLEIEEQRPMAQANDPLDCPLCGERCARVFAVRFGVGGKAQETVSPQGNTRSKHSFDCACCS